MFDYRFDTTIALRNVLLLCHIGTAFLLTVILALQWSTFELQGADIFFDDNSISSISYRCFFFGFIVMYCIIHQCWPQLMTLTSGHRSLNRLGEGPKSVFAF